MGYVSTAFDDKIVGILKKGGVGFMPSDTIYGLSARALDEAAAEKIARLKNRPADMRAIVLISDKEQLRELGVDITQTEAMKNYWPGKISLECQAPGAPKWLERRQGAFAVRQPDYPELITLIRKVGPIISTSANLHGQPPVSSVNEAKELFGHSLDFYVDAGQLPTSMPSTMVKLVSGKLEVIREGAVKL